MNAPFDHKEALQREIQVLASSLMVWADCYEADFPKSGYPHAMRKQAEKSLSKVGLPAYPETKAA